ncbi:FAD/NAD(P)-binding domain-containing protein [Myriangium duriaei CBS 260.36]|uniref:FAD/NAD(P)-binding domain-containing protein n=1 Tax=Myriangium duriaei CBS 260.36 TaxID=1168546 RepID=A0A9P4MJJ9_9PEZI|nr:FAD/NAD(P)-binding domain-containing protein [Myriangium duriaei CBS 260.36]
MDGPIRVAIIGGGLGGLTLANALLHQPSASEHIDLDHSGFEFHVYEAKPSFSERGAAVGLNSSAKKALKYCVPDARELLEKAGGVVMASTLMMIGSGEHAGAEAFNSERWSQNATNPDDEKTTVVHRASLLKALKSTLDPVIENQDILHTNKRVSRITTIQNDEVQLVFEDGQVETFDAVIGADGYRGVVRSYVLGDKAEEEAVSASGFWDCRNMVSMETANRVLLRPLRSSLLARAATDDREKVENYFGKPRQFGWAGDSGFIMHDVCESGTMVQCVMSSIEKEPWKERKRLLTREFLEHHMRDWNDGPVFSAMLDLMFTREQDGQCELYGWSQWHHKKTSTYNNGRVCIVGDAAHATTPWQGSGVGMAIEDAMILSHLLWNISSRSSIHAAFETFTEVRKERCQHIIESSEGTGKIFCAQEPGLSHQDPTTRAVSLDPKKMMGALLNRWDKIRALSHDDHRSDALARLQGKIGKTKA